ncbi:heme exporter protein CcmB [Parvibaculum sp. MBR-TMA-1.3b-4.2]|jgi:heme exporter protein B
MGRAIAALIARDLRLAVRAGGGGGMAVFFFLITVSVVAVGVGPNLSLLAQIAPGILWVALLLSSLLTLERLFQADLEDGTLDLLAMGPLPLEAIAAAKAFSHWLTTGLPLLVAAPLLGLLLNLPVNVFPPLILSMAIGTPALSFLGAIGAALTVGVRRGGLLASLLVVPFYVPVLIFGVGAADEAISGAPPGVMMQALSFLGAVTLASLVIGPVAAAAGLRAALK